MIVLHEQNIRQKPKHPVHVKKSREGVIGGGGHHHHSADNRNGTDQPIHVAKRAKKNCDISSDNIHTNGTTTGNNAPPHPLPKEHSPTVALDGCVMAGGGGSSNTQSVCSKLELKLLVA